METSQVAQLLNDTFSSDGDTIRTATEALDRLSLLPHFPSSLLSIATGGANQGQKVAAATYLKNFTRRNIEGGASNFKVSKEFKDQLMRTLLQVEPVVLKVLVEVFRAIVVSEFVKENMWPELVPELCSAIQTSNLISNGMNCGWSTVNALSVLQALIRPFQYFLNPKVAKEPVPPQLELIAKDILVPLLALFHRLVEKVLATQDRTEAETEKVLLLVCKCVYCSVRSYMPSTLAPILPAICRDLIGILGSLNFGGLVNLEDGYMLRLKTAKRSLLIFCALVTRHRKYSDKLMPDMINCALNIVKYSTNISKLDCLSERVISLSFDVIARILETGPGWRIVSPHFSVLLDSAIFPALAMNEKDISEWEEDADEYIRKNLPSDLEEVSGWREDLFTARKSAINLLGVISMSKGPPIGNSSNGFSASSKRKKGEKNKSNKQRSSMGELLVLPYLSKFPIPSNITASQTRILNDYFGVLMAYGSLQDFLREQKPGYTVALVQTRILPLYRLSVHVPYLIATANWVLGELASSLPEEMSADVYSSLMKALGMLDTEDTSCYPVRASAAGSIAGLLENDYPPPEWSPLLQAVIGRIGSEDEESSILFELLSSVVEVGNENVTEHIPYIVSSLVDAISKCIPPHPSPWPQVVERGFAALAVMAQSWESYDPEEAELKESSDKWASGQAAIGRAFSTLLQQAWFTPIHILECKVSPSTSCIEDSSALLRSIVLSVTGSNDILQLKVSELLSIWADLIADWHAWEESEDLLIFDCIKEVVTLQSKYGLKNFIVGQMTPPPAPPVSQRSVIEGIGSFVSEAILQYPSATWRACACVHILLHVPIYSFEAEGVKQSLAIAFSRAAFSRFRETRSQPCALWKPLLLAISSCYVTCPDIVAGILEKDEVKGVALWVSALGFVCTSSFEPGLSAESEIKLIIMALAKVVEQLLALGNRDAGMLRDCFISLMEASVRLKDVQKEREEEEEDNNDEEEEEDEDEDDDDDETEDDEDSEEDELEETEAEFLDRYAKTALALEEGSAIEEGDEEDQDHEIELGCLEEVDGQRVVGQLIERYHDILVKGQVLPVPLISSFLTAFPEYSLFFQQSS